MSDLLKRLLQKNDVSERDLALTQTELTEKNNTVESVTVSPSVPLEKTGVTVNSVSVSPSVLPENTPKNDVFEKGPSTDSDRNDSSLEMVRPGLWRDPEVDFGPMDEMRSARKIENDNRLWVCKGGTVKSLWGYTGPPPIDPESYRGRIAYSKKNPFPWPEE